MLRKIYSIYVLPIMFLHEFMHILACWIFNVKIYKINFTYNKYYNLDMFTEFSGKKYKHYIISFFPILLFPFFLLILLNYTLIGLIIGAYLLTTIYNFNILFMPSISDIFYAKKYPYYKYVEKNIGLNKLNDLIKKNENISEYCKYNNLLTEYEYFIR